jgi:uncharacterized SAM-dependent methyltransferase
MKRPIPMAHLIILQTEEMVKRRVAGQLRRGRVDVGLYSVGGELMAQAWEEMEDRPPPRTWDITSGPIRDHYGEDERCVVDLGPGSGKPCLAATNAILDHIHEIVLVDVSRELLAMAQDYLQRNSPATITCIIADFLQDIEALDAVLKDFLRPKLFLCLGNTVGSFSQPYVLHTLRSLLGDEDYILLGLSLYPQEHSEEFLKDLANRYVEETNFFGLHFLTACGADPASHHTFARLERDDDDPAIPVIRIFYRFPKETFLTMGEEKMTFQEGKSLQILESRRFLLDQVERHLKKYGLNVIASQHLDTRGLFLCRRV